MLHCKILFKWIEVTRELLAKDCEPNEKRCQQCHSVKAFLQCLDP